MNLHLRRHAALLCLPLVALALTACGGSSSDDKESKDSTSFGVKATGKFGEKPDLTVPSGEAPAELKSEVLSEGDGKTVASGQTLIANYLGQTWKPKEDKENVFDNSYDRGQAAGFLIGAGKVIVGWDKVLVGKKIGSRVLMSVPPEDAYGKKGEAKAGQEEHELAGEALVFVVDIIDSVDKDKAADGEKAGTALPAGFPEISSEPGKKPTITSVKGVKTGSTPSSALLLAGKGETIDSKKSLLMELIQTDAATGKQTQQTWGSSLELVAAEQVLSIASSLKDQKVGSRAVSVVPAQSGSSAMGATVLVIDIVGQY
ncbi:MAG: peptidylprolyl isomerase [Actinomycetota bacterium]|nr:peptidylprolyl isomerase [Actinomycetota bacterium]